MRVRDALCAATLAASIGLPTVTAAAGVPDLFGIADPAAVRTMAHIKQFCATAEGASFMPDGMHRHPQPYLAGWASQRQFAVDVGKAGAVVTIILQARADIRLVAAERSRFVEAFARTCPEGAKVVKVIGTAVQGSDTVTGTSGIKSF